MFIGKIKMQLLYDIQCDFCGSHRSTEHEQLLPITTKPTAKILQRQIQKLAGLSLRENSSGKHKGQTTISKRGRSKLRAVLFNAAIPLIAKNPEFRSLHEYYTTRANNPLSYTLMTLVV